MRLQRLRESRVGFPTPALGSLLLLEPFLCLSGRLLAVSLPLSAPSAMGSCWQLSAGTWHDPIYTFLKKVFIEFVTISLLFYVLVFWPQGMWDLSSLTRDQTCTPCIGRQSLNHWTAREVP